MANANLCNGRTAADGGGGRDRQRIVCGTHFCFCFCLGWRLSLFLPYDQHQHPPPPPPGAVLPAHHLPFPSRALCVSASLHRKDRLPDLSTTTMALSQNEEAREKLRAAEAEAKQSATHARDALYGASSSAQSAARDGVDQARSTASSLQSSAERQLSQAGNQLGSASSSLQQSAASFATDVKGTVQGLTLGQPSTDPTAWVPRYSVSDYMRFFSAGALCATITHGAMTPVDVVKTRLQLEPAGSKLGMASMARGIVAAEGPAGLLAGFGPTAVGAYGGAGHVTSMDER